MTEQPMPFDITRPDVLVVIPTIPGREELLRRAVASIREDISLVTVVGAVETDTDGNGPSITRNRAVVRTLEQGIHPKWLAFLDDDDEFHEGHLARLTAHTAGRALDVVYPWFDLSIGGRVNNGRDPLGSFGKPFDPEALRENNFIPVTALVRTELFIQVGGFPEVNSEAWPHKDCEDWGLWLRLLDAGAVFSHLPERTWTWHWHGKNTSGRPDRAARLYGGKP